MSPQSPSYDLTSEQATIVERARLGESLRVLALAGTGKTSTLVEIARRVRLPGLYLAFNRSIAAEARRKFPSHVLVKTAHALAFGALGHHFQGQGRLEISTWALRQAIMERFATELSYIAGRRRLSNAAFALLDTLTSFFSSPAERVTSAHVPAEHFELDTTAVARLAQSVFDAMSDLGGTFPTTHDGYLKAWALSRPHLPFQIVYFDEAQDANDVLVDLVQRQTHLQRIWVGDQNQSIYSFRHAVDALGTIDLPAYPLTQSWRFGPRVAKIANAILWAKDEPLRVRGRPDREDRIAQIDIPDIILARTNAGLFEEAVSLMPRLDKDRLAFVGGVDDVLNMVAAAFELRSQGRTTHRGFRFFQQWGELQSLVEQGQGGEFAPFVKLVERHGPEIPAMCQAIRAASVADERHARVLFSTAHKFKGREKPSVRLAGDFPEFCGFNFKTRRLEFRFEEANLAYVAVTRAEHVLDLGDYQPLLLSSLEQRKRLPGPARDFAA